MSVDITMDGTLKRMVDRLLNAGPAIRRDMNASTVRVANTAALRWPVSKSHRKKHSRDEIETGEALDAGNVVAFVLIDVDYAFYIKSWQNGLAGKSPWQELIRKPGIVEGKRLAGELAETMAEIAGGRRG